MNVKNLVLLFILMFSCPTLAGGLAFVIGNSQYKNIGRLDNPANDANLISTQLKKLDFEVKNISNLDEQSFRQLVKTISRESQKYDSTIIYYAGHAVQLAGENFLLPVDQEPPTTEEDIRITAIKMDDLLASMKSPIRVLIMDACRDNPLLQKNMSSRGRGLISRGLAAPSSSQLGTFVAYATDSGNVASDGAGRNSPFAIALAENLLNQESIDDMFARVTKKVLLLTNGSQRPFKYASLEDRFCLYGPCSSGVPATAQESKAVEASAKNTSSIPQDRISLEPRLANSYQKWITYAMGEGVLYQFDPRSFQYDYSTQSVKFIQKVAYLSKGFASIFKRIEKYSLNTAVFYCAENYFTFLSTANFKSDDTLLTTATFSEQERQRFDIPKQSIAESAVKIFCGKMASVFNIIPGTTSDGLIPFGADQDGTYWWASGAKMPYETGHVYAVLFKYLSAINNKATGEKIIGQVIVASATCSNAKKAKILRRFYIDDSNKISGITFEETEIDIFPNSVGENIFKVDCK